MGGGDKLETERVRWFRERLETEMGSQRKVRDRDGEPEKG